MLRGHLRWRGILGLGRWRCGLRRRRDRFCGSHLRGARRRFAANAAKGHVILQCRSTSGAKTRHNNPPTHSPPVEQYRSPEIKSDVRTCRTRPEHAASTRLIAFSDRYKHLAGLPTARDRLKYARKTVTFRGKTGGAIIAQHSASGDACHATAIDCYRNRHRRRSNGGDPM